MNDINGIIGKKFSKLIVIQERGRDKHGSILLECLCDCGKTTIIPKGRIKSGHTGSCGKCNQDISGKKFGKLTVICQVERLKNANQSCWKCLCDCGNYIVRVGSNLRNGNTKSCGCLQPETVKKINCLPLGQSAINRAKRDYKREAKARNLAWELSDECFIKLTQGICYYCGKEPSQVYAGKNGNYIYNGIDRVDNLKGYIEENCVTCCKDCNYAKRNMTYENFISMCRQIVFKYNIRLDEKYCDWCI